MTLPPTSIADRIARAQPAFSRTQHRMAEYVLAHQFRVATMTIDEFAVAVGVSVATANRFARVLELPGYPQFRAELARGFESALEPVEKLRIELAHSASAAQVFAATLQEDIHNAQMTLQALDAGACERAVEAILNAERVFIIGFGTSGFLAGLLQRGLCMHLHAVESLAGPGGVSHAARQMSRMTSRDLVIALAFPRYLADTVTLANAAKLAGVPVLVLTDKPTSPLAPCATVALYAHMSRQLSSNAETAALGLIEALSAAVAHRAKNSIAAAAGVAQSVMPWLIHGEAGAGKR
ncbi:MurR/RpiR family transcriptional regulator [Bordetella parapertussis]|uniref:Transcriptional regulator n=2 Tax=Bordetella parapertussis TaxID=519 RepID=Q7W5M7_BORPA|nr:MurR/RpiR family transcriptional regulator [Bordetella parapertussis]AOB40231.1 transcriptional regulator [Bordetella parapertussis]AUL44251.1 transcriptional regulator [Bordetella parapertussis]AWP64156.1 MurR/RpiR family transcriptional regulator [Bordetella parapertussis]AWP71660.1 MurR/RpiR family transcriptional regulator [Bordetella parapertussis]AWP90265.1 MurR/RpiR family transcriptional regulator [Bordetella parapertussis]